MNYIPSIRFSEKDNVVVALEKALPKDVMQFHGGTLTLRSAIEPGFKAALCDIVEGETVLKYGEPIGIARRRIKAGERVQVADRKSVV